MFLLIGLAVGAGLGFAVAMWRSAARLSDLRAERDEERAAGAARASGLERDVESLRAQLEEAKAERSALRGDLESARAETGRARADLAQARQQLESERHAAEEKLALLGDAKKALADQFKALAAESLEANSKTFGEANKERLESLLKPFSERIERFQSQVKEAYETEGKERAGLKQELKQLAELNLQMSEDAKSLSQALKGQAKTRGDWGEIILERLLQAAGLREGHEYRTQASYRDEDGSRLQPDVVVDLPDDKHIVIDAKLNLIAWLQVSDATEPVEIEVARKGLSTAIRTHMRQLGGKNYQQLYGIDTVDFVLMFIPIEAAFSEALTHDHTLYQDALNQNIVLVSPTTLLATMRTIAAIWRYDRQEQNAFKIADLAGKMYDQLTRYVESFEKVGERLRQAQGSYDEAHRRLVSGRGDLIGRAEKVRAMGAKAAKRLGKDLRELALGADAVEDQEEAEAEAEATREGDLAQGSGASGSDPHGD